MAQDKEHWQVDRTLQQWNQHLLEHSQRYSDVTFHVHCKQHSSAAPVEIRALRMLLLARSPVFHAMFSGDWKEAKGDIYVDDIEPDAFREMLRFVYTDEVMLTTDNVTGVLYAPKKYIITNLSKKCIEFLQAELTPHTAAQILELSLLYDELELKERVLCEIERNPRTVLLSESFIQISKATLHEILQLDTLPIKEIVLFQATMEWAINKCEESKEPVNGQNIRKALGDDLHLLRFPTMDIKEYFIVQPYCVLTPAEGVELLRYWAKKSTQADAMKFPTEKRGPRVLLTGPFKVKNGFTARTLGIDNRITARLSRGVHLTKLFVHGCEISHGFAHCLQVIVKQNNKRLFVYKGAHPTSPMASGVYPQYAVDIPRVSLEAGKLQICINLTITCKHPSLHTLGKIAIQTSPAAEELRDRVMRMSFLPTADNLLLGMEYDLNTL